MGWDSPGSPSTEVIFALHGVTSEGQEHSRGDEQGLQYQVHVIERDQDTQRQPLTDGLRGEVEDKRVVSMEVWCTYKGQKEVEIDGRFISLDNQSNENPNCGQHQDNAKCRAIE